MGLLGLSRYETLIEFGYKSDPFRGVRIKTTDAARVAKALRMAVESRGMLSVVSGTGAGKSEAVNSSLADVEAVVVRLVTADCERVTVADIERALVCSLSNEEPRRSREVRAIQVRALLGCVSKEKDVVLVLEEAHRMHHQTLRSLKTLREMSWQGRSPLFTAILVGQFDPLARPSLREVSLRSGAIRLKGLARCEVEDFIGRTVGSNFDGGAVDAVLRLPESRNFLELEEVLITLMSHALSTGRKRVEVIDVYEQFQGGLNELVDRLNINTTEVAKRAGVSKTVISMIKNGKAEQLTEETYNIGKKGLMEAIDARLNNGERRDAKAVGC